MKFPAREELRFARGEFSKNPYTQNQQQRIRGWALEKWQRAQSQLTLTDPRRLRGVNVLRRLY